MPAIDDDLLALERQLLAEGAGPYLTAVEELKKLVALGDPNVAAKIGELISLARSGALDLAAVTANIDAAYVTSVLDNGAIVGRSATDEQLGTILKRAQVPPPVHAAGMLDDIAKAAFKAQALLLAGIDPATAAGVMIANGRSTTAGLQWLLHEQAAKGTTDVARIAKMPMVWVAERDACVRCLAHSGHVVQVGGKFPAGLSFGPYTYDDAVKTPPLHPHCRCHMEVLNDPAYAEALQREARRSVLRGYSLESESMGVRIKAAKKLLDDGVDAPKTVQAHAGAAVKRGKFNTRTVPRVRPQGPPDQPRHSSPPPKAPTPTPAPAKHADEKAKASAKLAETRAQIERVKAEREAIRTATLEATARLRGYVPPTTVAKAVRGASPSVRKSALTSGDWRYVEDAGQRANVLLQNDFRSEQAVKKVAKNLREGAQPFAGVGLPKAWVKTYTGTVEEGTTPVRFTEGDVRGSIEDAARWLNAQEVVKPRVLYKGLDVPKEKISKLFTEGADFDTNFSSFTTDDVVARKYSSSRASKQVMVRVKGVEAIPLKGNPTAEHWKKSKEHLVTGKGRVVKVVDDGRTVWVDVEFE